MKRILVTGADGFTGRHLVGALCRDYEVHGIVHSHGADRSGRLAMTHQVDLLNADRLAAIVRSVRPDVVVHLAAVSFVGHGDVAEIYKVNVIGTRNLLAAAADAQCRLMLLASSANVYGRTGGVINEAVSPAPVNDYAVSKLSMEHLVGCFPSVQTIIARPFNYTGRGQSSNFVLAKIIEHIRRREPVIRLGNLDVERDYSDVRMVVGAYRQLLESPAAVGRTFNICSGVGRSLLQIVEMAVRIGGHRLKIEIDPTLVRNNEVHSLVGDGAFFEKSVGKLDRIPIEDTLRWMLED